MHRISGFTLIELIVSVALASVLGLMAFNLLFQQQRAWAQSLAQQQLLEEGMLVLTALQDDIQHAGYAINGHTVPTFMQEVATSSRYDASHSLLSLASYDVADCLGREVEIDALEQPVINQYYVRTVEESGPVQALFCRAFDGSTWEEVELIRGVALFQARVAVWQEETMQWVYMRPHTVPQGAVVKQVEVDLLLRHPSVVPLHVEGPYHYENAWGERTQLEGQAYYERFFLLAEVLNG